MSIRWLGVSKRNETAWWISNEKKLARNFVYGTLSINMQAMHKVLQTWALLIGKMTELCADWQVLMRFRGPLEKWLIYGAVKNLKAIQHIWLFLGLYWLSSKLCDVIHSQYGLRGCYAKFKKFPHKQQKVLPVEGLTINWNGAFVCRNSYHHAFVTHS